MQKIQSLSYSKRARFVIITWFLLCFSTLSWSTSSVWKITNKDHFFYLAGTMHVLKTEDYPLPRVFEIAYQKASHIVLEVDLTKLDNNKFQKKIMGQDFYGPGNNLKTQLNTKAWSALYNYCRQRGMDVNGFLTMPVGIVVTSIAMAELQMLGLHQQGVDAYIMDKALEDKKLISGLETADEQINFLLAMGKGDESNFILQNLDELNTLAADIDQLRQAWRQGDMNKIDELMIANMKKQYPKVYQKLLVQRNLNWLPQLKTMMETEDVEYVLVGAAHIAGEHGLLELLKQQGFNIEQLEK